MSELAESRHSSALEKVLEHLFVGDLLRCLGQRGIWDVEVLRSEVDSSGYDLVVECKDTMRHIQLKASHQDARAQSVKINKKLESKRSGCVIWMFYDRDLQLGPFLWFGAAPGLPMPSLGDKIAKHTKGDQTGKKAERPNIRVLAKSRFKRRESMKELVGALFGVN